MYCTKCGTNNEDNNTFCKNCGAKLVKPANNSSVSSVPSSSGVAQAAKAVNVKLIAGIAAALVVVVMVAGVLMNVGKGGKTLFEQIEIGKTTLVDVEKYFDKNNLGSTWCKENTMYKVDDGIWLAVPDWRDTGWGFEESMLWSSSNAYLYDSFLIHNDLSDTLWGANCDYFVAMSGNKDEKDKARKALFMACVVQIDGNTGEREFRQSLNEYLKKNQKTDLKNQKFNDGMEMDFVFYPLEITTINGEKVLICLNCNYGFLKSDGIILFALYAEPYYTEKDLNEIMKENVPASEILFWDPDDHVLFNDKEVGWYFNLTMTEKYPEFQKAELGAINKEVPDFECSIDTYTINEGSLYREEKCIVIERCNSDKSDNTIPESIYGYPVKKIGEHAFSDCINLTNIELPEGITSIGYGAFSSCFNIKSIKIPDSITNIDSSAFAGCSSLKEIELPNGVTEIKDYTFSGCVSLESINIDNNITVIADNAFDGCETLVSEELNVRFPNAIPKPAWLEAYRAFGTIIYDSDDEMCLMNFNHTGTPHLVIGDMFYESAVYSFWTFLIQD